MFVNPWSLLSQWIFSQTHNPRSLRAKRRRPATVWSGLRRAAALSIEALEPRTLPTGEAFLLHSLPGATKHIYLDFNGYTTHGTYWNTQYAGGADIVTTPFSIDADTSTFSATEEQRITEIWRIVAEDYAPFNVDVTTEDPGIEALRKTGGADTDWGIRAVIGGNSGWYPAGSSVGVAILTSFTYPDDVPLFAFTDRMPDYSAAPFMAIANTVSHEVGHSLGLGHDGTTQTQTFGGPSDYYFGHYTSPGGMIWGPIMGSPIIYNNIVSQWSKGEYPGATNTQDDLAIITSQNGFDYRVDDHGSSTGTADDVSITDVHHATASGIIERNTDLDYFKFYVQQAGTVQINFQSALSQYFTSYNAVVSDLDILGTLYDSTGTAIASNNPAESLEASISMSLNPGIYYFSIDGVGKGDPATTGYSDYGSLGQYVVSLSTTTGVLSLNYPNTAPTDLSLSNSTFAENVPLSTAIGTFSTTDADSNNTFSYSLVSGGGSADNAKFSIVGNTLVTNAPFDYETQTSYSIRIRTTDQGGLSFEKQLTITLTNVNEAPTNISLSANSLAENNSNPTTVGTLGATDVDAGNSFSFSLVAGAGSADNGSFSIVGNSLKINTVTNYEVKNSYSIRVQVTDQGGLTFEKQFTISVTDVDEAPTDLTLAPSSINENNLPNATVGTLSGTDADGGSSFTFTLVAGTGSTDNASFSIAGNALRIIPTTNFEGQNNYSIRIRVTDQTGLTFEKPFVVTVNDVNESPTDISLSSTTLAENNLPSAVVATLTASDPDAGATFTYQLVAGAGADDNGRFSVSTNNLKIIDPADFETQSSYSIRLRVTDQGGLSFEKSFTINVTDVNDAPDLLDLSNTEIGENSGVMTVVGNLSTHDQDPGNTFTYSLVPGPGANDNGSFTISGDALILISDPDFESQDTYFVRVRVTDQGGLSFDQTFTIDVLDENEAPIDIVLSSASIAESNQLLDTVGFLSAIDPDFGNTFTFDLIDGPGDNDNGSFLVIGDELCINTTADYETQSSYSFRLIVTDQGGLSFEKAVTINVIDVNEAPTGIQLSSTTIAENNQPFDAVGLFSASDPDAGSSFSYDLVTGAGDTDNDSFFIFDKTLYILATADFEFQDSYAIRVQVTDQGGLSYEQEFTINVNDVNEAPDDLELFGSQVVENNPEFSDVGFFVGDDPDAGNTLTYSLVPGLGDDDNASFAIVNDTLVIVPSTDFELQDSYSIRVRVTDQDGLSLESTFFIDVLDENEAPTDIDLSPPWITENAPVQSEILTLSTFDPDFDDTFTYELIDGPGGIDNDAFVLQGDELWIASPADFESQASYSILVRVTDQGGLTFEKSFTIDVLDVDEAPTALTLSNSNLDEDNFPFEIVGTFDGSDPDNGDFLSYVLVNGPGGVDNSLFEIDDNQLVLIPSADYETHSSYSIRVAAVDLEGLMYESQFTITINDINEAPTDILLSNTSVAEHAAAGAAVGTLAGVDEDATQTFSYSLIDGPGSDDNDSFTITGNTLSINIIPDFEAQPTYSIRVEVADQNGLAYEKVLTVTVTDQNDAPAIAAGQTFSVSEAALHGATVGQVVATDPDATAPNNVLVYAIVGGNPGGVFSIDGLTGEILVDDAADLDFETTTQYTLQIQVTDLGTGNLTATQQVLVDVTNVNEPPSIAAHAGFTLPENSAASTPLGTMTATDPDAGDTLTFSIVAGNTLSAFAINPTTGLLTVANTAALNFEVTPQFNLTIQVADELGATDSTAVTINLTDVDETHQLELGGTSVTWINKHSPAAILPLATVLGLQDVGGGTLTITANAVGTAKKLLDQFSVPSIRNIGSSSGAHFVNGQLTLQVSLDSTSTTDALATFLHDLKFATKGKGFKTTTRTVHVTLVDGVGSTSTFTQTINVRKKA